MKRETPRDRDGNKVCAWCGDPIKQSGVGRSKDYCSRTHREYAYRARREAEIRIAAYSRGRADGRTVSSTDETGDGAITSVDEMKPAAQSPVPAPGRSDDFLLPPPIPVAQAPDVQQTPALPMPPRRRLSRYRSGMRAEAMPLWRPDEHEPPETP